MCHQKPGSFGLNIRGTMAKIKRNFQSPSSMIELVAMIGLRFIFWRLERKLQHRELSTTLLSLVNAIVVVGMILLEAPVAWIMRTITAFLVVDLPRLTHTYTMYLHHLIGIVSIVLCTVEPPAELFMVEVSTIFLDLVYLGKMAKLSKFIILPLKCLFILTFLFFRVLMYPVIWVPHIPNDTIYCFLCSLVIYLLQLHWFRLIVNKLRASDKTAVWDQHQEKMTQSSVYQHI